MSEVSTRVQLCGRMVVEWDGERLEQALPGRQGRLLFAYLVLHRGRPVRRDELVEALWSDEGPPSRGESVLAPPLSRLRKALGPGRLEGRGELALAMPADAWIDWEVAHDGLARARSAIESGDARTAFDAAQQAVEIAERGLLPELEAPWIDERRRDLDDLRIDALEAVALAGVGLGGAELQAAQKAARAAVEAAPFRESARAALIEVLRARGNVAEAMQAYEELRTFLREELGTAPGPRLMALHEKLLRAEDHPAGTEPPPAQVARAGPVLAPAPAAPPPPRGPGMVEREREVAVLDALVADALAGQGRMALIEGPAGIGKSRLLTELRRRPDVEGTVSLMARGSELERQFPFGVVRQLFEGVVAQYGEQAFAGAAEPARTVFSALEDPQRSEQGADASFAALHGLFWLALNLANERPLVLAVDDIQWADSASLRFIAYLVRRLEGLPILVAATLRTGDPFEDPTLLAEIANDPSTMSVRPSPLSRDAVRGLVEEHLGPDSEETFCAACHDATGGNPLLLRQLLAALQADSVRPSAEHVEVVRQVGPRAVSRSVLLRLARLPGDAVAVARAVAVLGEGAELPAVAGLSELGETSVGEAIGALTRAEILRQEPPPGFVHPLVRDAVYHELPAGERELQHARAAEVLAETDAAAEQVAAHLLVTPRRGQQWVVGTLRMAARTAIAKGAPDSAVTYLTRALAEPPPPELRGELLHELGNAEELTSGPAAVEHLRDAYELLEDPKERARVARTLTRTLIFTAPPEEAVALARRAASELPEEMVDERNALQALEAMAIWFGSGDEELLRMLEPYRTRREHQGPGSKMLYALVAFDWALRGGSAEECAALAREALADDVIRKVDTGFVIVGAISTLVFADDEEGFTQWDIAMSDGYRQGSLFLISTVSLWRGFTLLYRGELEDAEESLRNALHELNLWGFLHAGNTYAAAFLGWTLVERGKVEEARQVLDRGGRPPSDTDGGRLWLRTSVEVLLAEGRAEEALEEAELLSKTLTFIENPAWAPWRSLKALALDRLGRGDEAIALLEEELELSRRWGAPGTVGRTLRILGTVKREEGIAELEEAAELLAGSTRRLEHAKALAALGAALRRARRPTDAREPLRQALELADASGADGLAEEVRSELYAAGARPRTEALSGVAALTDRERRVVALAAEGETNRDIAQTLYVTPKTVEVHLSNAYRKLGVRSRRELPGVLAET